MQTFKTNYRYILYTLSVKNKTSRMASYKRHLLVVELVHWEGMYTRNHQYFILIFRTFERIGQA